MCIRDRYARHPDFQPRGADLLYDLAVTPWEAVLGTTVKVPTLEGSVSLRVPPGTPSGLTMRARSRGLVTISGERGDLLVSVTIKVPESVNEAERELWEKLAETSSFNPRGD